jgi:hypothetical protein
MVLQRKLVVPSQRMPSPVFGAENATQVGVAGKFNTHEVIGFAFVPVGNAPDGTY